MLFQIWESNQNQRNKMTHKEYLSIVVAVFLLLTIGFSIVVISSNLATAIGVYMLILGGNIYKKL